MKSGRKEATYLPSKADEMGRKVNIYPNDHIEKCQPHLLGYSCPSQYRRSWDWRKNGSIRKRRYWEEL